MSKQNFLYKNALNTSQKAVIGDVDEYSFKNTGPAYDSSGRQVRTHWYVWPNDISSEDIHNEHRCQD